MKCAATLIDPHGPAIVVMCHCHHQGVRNAELLKAAAQKAFVRSEKTQTNSTPWRPGALSLDPAQLSKLLWACVALKNAAAPLSETQGALFRRCSEHLSGRGGMAGFHAKEAVRVAAAMSQAGVSSSGLYAALGRAVLRQRLELT